MRTTIVYYSKHHGNTKRLLDAIAATEKVTLIDVTEQPSADLSGYDRDTEQHHDDSVLRDAYAHLVRIKVRPSADQKLDRSEHQKYQTYDESDCQERSRAVCYAEYARAYHRDAREHHQCSHRLLLACRRGSTPSAGVCYTTTP
jgi:hypothetical protein